MTKHEHRVYNAGDRIFLNVPLDHPLGYDNACKAFATVDIPKRSWGKVATTVDVVGHEVAAPNMLAYIQEKFPWVIAVDRNLEDTEEEANVAESDEIAKKRAEGRWKLHLQASVEMHFANVQRMRTLNLPAPRAIGFTKRALEELSIEDPAAIKGLEVGKNTAVDDLRAELELLKKQLLAKAK